MNKREKIHSRDPSRNGTDDFDSLGPEDERLATPTTRFMNKREKELRNKNVSQLRQIIIIDVKIHTHTPHVEKGINPRMTRIGGSRNLTVLKSVKLYT
eukprot:UN06793